MLDVCTGATPSILALPQVGSPSPELGRLVCFALTGNSGDTARLDADGAATAASTAASAGLLEDDSLFRHFFGCLAAGVGIDESTGSDGGDGPYARILEEVRAYYSGTCWEICDVWTVGNSTTRKAQ